MSMLPELEEQLELGIETDMVDEFEKELENQTKTDSEVEIDEDEDELNDEESIRAGIIRRGPPPQQWDNTKLKFFNASLHTAEIRALARGLTQDETLAFYGVTKDLLPEYDAWYFEINYIRGRINGKQDAVARLFTNMREPKSGHHAALAYLNTFADSFKHADNSSTKTPKAVRITFDD